MLKFVHQFSNSPSIANMYVKIGGFVSNLPFFSVCHLNISKFRWITANIISNPQTTVNRDGSLSFECQHGAVECDANTYHACTVEAVQEQNVLLDIISCMIANNFNPKEALISCAQSNHFDYDGILKCFNSPHGAELLKLHGEATDALRPRVSFIPTVTLDGSQGRQASILKDLFGEVCKVAAGHGPLPAICTNHSYD